MPLRLDANGNITTPSGDTGIYTWSDVVALNSPKMTIYGSAENYTYRWTGILDIRGNSVLNILNQTIECYGTSLTTPGIIRATESGTINFGEKVVINGQTYTRKGCNITLTRTFYSSIQDDTAYASLSYAAFYDQRFISTSSLNIYNTRIYSSDSELIVGSEKAIKYFVSEVLDSTLVSFRQDNFDFYNSIIKNTFFLTTNGTLKNTQIVNVTCDLLGVASIENVTLLGSLAGIRAYIGAFLNAATTVEVEGATTANNLFDFFVDQATGINFINAPNVNLVNGRVNGVSDTFPEVESKQLFTHNLQLKDSNGWVNNALVTYTGRSNINVTSNNSGLIPLIKLISKETNFSSLPFDFGYYPPLPVVDYSTYVRTIKSYLHTEEIENLIVTSQIGTNTQPSVISLTIDVGITQTSTSIVQTYTGITHTASTITITEPRTLNEIYDSRKLYWRNNAGTTVITKEADIFNLGNTNLIVDGVNLVTTNKFKSIITTGTITYLNNGNTSFATTDINGLRYRIYGLPTKVNSLPVIRVKNLTTNVITNPTVINGEVYIVVDANTSYEIRADARGYLASNFIVINTAISSELKIDLIEFKDNSGSTIYGNGVTAEKNLINFDLSTLTLLITYSVTVSTISLFSIIDKIEETLATNAGLEVTAYPIYQNNKLVFTRDILTNNQNNIKIKPDNTNTSDPELLFELVREGDEKPYNLFDFSTSNGRTIKYPTTVNVASFNGQVTVNNQEVATAVWSNNTRTLTTSSALTTEQAAKLNNLDVAVSTRLAATSYTQAPTAAQIKTDIESSTVLAKEVTVSSRASQTSLNAIPTNPLLTNDSRLNNIDTSISSRLASNAYNEAPTVTDIRTELSTELSRIDATVSSRATSANVWTNSTRSLTEGVIVTTNNDKTDYSLSSNSINNIWNTLITSLTTIGSIGKRIVDFLDTTISSRSSESTISNINTKVNSIPSNPLLTTDVRLNTLDANISTRLATNTYLAPLTSTETSTLINNALSTITISGLTEEQNNKLNEISTNILKLKKLRGLVSGVNVIAKAPSEIPGYLRTSDNDINLVITKNGDEEILSG